MVHDTFTKSQYSLIVTLAFSALLACDPLYYGQKFCNGFERPVVLTIFVENTPQYGKAEFQPGECKDSATFVTQMKEEKNARLPSGVTVTVTDGKTLANYSLEAASYGVGLGRRPSWVMTAKGIFVVPPEFEDTWRENISAIERSSGTSYPNRHSSEN